MLTEDVGFVKWLVKNKHYKERSAKDVVSRVNRVQKIIEIPKNDIYIDTIDDLKSSPKYKQLSPAVKCQLKRACTLYIEYLEDNTRNIIE